MGMAKPEGFRILAGERDLSFYEWGAKTAKRYFCKRCGVSCFSRGYLEQLGGEYVRAPTSAGRHAMAGQFFNKRWSNVTSGAPSRSASSTNSVS